jgi:transglutaminase-like putative cysteine protease
VTLHRDLIRAGLAITLMIGALSSLTRVFSELSWVAVTFGAALVAVAIATVTRALGFGLVGSLVSTTAGLFVFVYTQHLAAGPLVPGFEQLREALDLFKLGMTQFRDEPAPTVPLDGLLMITSTSAWMIGWLTHELLVRWRSTGIAILLAGVLWAVPLAVPLPAGRTWPQALPFALAAAITLLFEGDRGVVGEPAQVRTDAGGGSLAVGGMLAGIAMVVAALAPAILPGYGQDPWVQWTAGPDPRGYQPIVDIGDRLMLPDPVDIMIVQSDRKVYLRLAALDSFDGTTWKVGPGDQPTFVPSPDSLFPADGQLPREVPIAQTVPLEVEVEVLDLENIYVPVPYQPVRLSGDGVQDMVYSTEGGFVAAGRLEDNEIGGRDASGVRAGTQYRVESVLPAASYETLAAVEYSPAAVARWTALPRDYSPLALTALDIYNAAGASTAIDRAFALQEWFTGEDSEFRYSLEVDTLRGDAALEDFLYGTKTGYCEYFATAMAVMLRATGIPARVSVGFLAGTLTLAADPGVGRTQNTYTVSSTDAHAWVEVLFPGHGWVRFEPTPRSDGSVQQPTSENLDPLLTEREQLLDELAQQAAQEDAAPTEDPDAIESERALQQFNEENIGTSDDARSTRIPVAIFPLLALLAAASIPLVRFRGQAHHDELGADDRVRMAQRRVHQRARAYGLARRDNETPREVAERWIREGRVEPVAAHHFTDLVEASVFGQGAAGTDGALAEQLGGVLVDGLASSVSARERLLAPWRQPSQNLRSGAVAARRYWTQGR